MDEAPAEAQDSALLSTLSPEAEAELQAELAAVEREMADAGISPEASEADAPVAEDRAETEALASPEAVLEVAAPQDAEPAAEAAQAEQAEAEDLAFEEDDGSAAPRDGDRRVMLESSAETGDQAMSRLLLHAASELDEPDNRRRLSTIAHLKAAVAATEADKELSQNIGDRSGQSELDRYRDDLAQVVRPRRPLASASVTTRPQAPTERPAPLVLVSEQRIDKGPKSEPLVIRPRRVTNGNLALEEPQEHIEDEEDSPSIGQDAQSFSDFIRNTGAHDLPDLLEAAAAYAACIEGRPHFSRPQILRSANSAAHEELSRESSLRAFGMLLRQGKIQKIKRGQFAISDTSHYLTEARKFAQ